jgi:hypothetical protein
MSLKSHRFWILVLGCAGIFGHCATLQADVYQYTKSFGDYTGATGVAVDAQDRVYLATYSNGIKRYDNNGALLDSFSPGYNVDSIAINKNTGSIYIGKDDGTVAVLDSSFHAVSTFSGTTYSGSYPGIDSITIDNTTGNVATHSTNYGHSLDVYSSNGTWQRTFTDNSMGTLFGMAYDSTGNLYLGDFNGNAIHGYNPSFSLVQSIGVSNAYYGGDLAIHDNLLFRCTSMSEPGPWPIEVYSLDTGISLGGFGEYGMGQGQFNSNIYTTKPMALDSLGNLYVSIWSTDSSQKAIYVFSTVPEPSTLVLAATGLMGLLIYARQHRTKKG